MARINRQAMESEALSRAINPLGRPDCERSMTPLYERFRPGSLADFVGNPKAVAIAQRLMGQGGRAVWISGPSGTGKTTLARIIAGSVADPKWATREVDAGAVSPETVRDWSDECQRFGWPGANGQHGRAYIVNEAHGLRAPTIRALLVWLESLPGHCVVIFTTTKAGEDKLFDDQIDASPLISRCVSISLTNQGLADAFAERLRDGAAQVGMDGQPVSEYVKLVRKHRNNLRACWQDIEAGCMIGGAA